MKILHGTLEPFPDAHALARAGAERFASLARAAADRGARFTAVLTGGSSPVEMYGLLGSDEFASRIPWEAVHLFWGDERAVPPGHPRSNFGMANGLFVSRVPIPPGNVHRMRGELGAVEGAAAYEEELHDFFGSAPLRWDLLHLGLGDNGHIASLFPYEYPALMERERWVIPAINPEIGEPRISLTYPAIAAAARIEFLLPSAGKAGMARTAMAGPLDPIRIPAQWVRPRHGELAWLTTEELVERTGLGA
jgi:6-phosphogluconolactonase